jgi:hypothetical protein
VEQRLDLALGHEAVPHHDPRPHRVGQPVEPRPERLDLLARHEEVRAVRPGGDESVEQLRPALVGAEPAEEQEHAPPVLRQPSAARLAACGPPRGRCSGR